MNFIKRKFNFRYFKITKCKFASKANMNQQLIDAKYEVRGTVAIKAAEIAERLKNGEKFNFERIYSLNIGNPQALNQKPITFPREVLSSLYFQKGSNSDAIERSKTYLNEIGSVNQFTDFLGMNLIRKNIASFINNRDGVNNVTSDDIIMTNGAGGGIRITLESILNANDSVMVPIPQYPLYTALIKLFACNAAGYYLNEEEGWTVDLKNMEKVYKEHYDKGQHIKAFVVINPGNPTGNVLSVENIRQMIEFCYKNGMIILADEVYQKNIYNTDKKFHSFRSVLSKMPYPYNQTTLFSYNSVSKGVFGECGMRGGYMDMLNVPNEIKELLYKLKVIEVCPNIAGQVIVDVQVNPPTLFNASQSTVEKFEQEVNYNFENLKTKAEILSKELNSIPGISCQNIDGAMYSFPNIKIPKFRIEQAKKLGIEPDTLFSLALLENTGIVGVPGSGFGQKEDTHHIRLTNLINPKEEMIKQIKVMKEFCADYFNENSKI